MMLYKPTANYKLIYVYTIHDEKHKGKLKVGKASLSSIKSEKQLPPNCPELLSAAKSRINGQTHTAMIDYEIFYAELAIRHITLDDGTDFTDIFEDREIHDVLKETGYAPLIFRESGRDSEWFTLTLDVVLDAINAYKAGYSMIPPKTTINSNQALENKKEIILRTEQADNVVKTMSIFRNDDTMLWDCKMRYGKTVTAYELIKRMGLKRVIVVTHRPAVEDSWDTDHDLIFGDTNHKFVDKTKDSLDGYDEIKDSKNDKILSDLIHFDTPFIYFASMQDLRGSARVGGNFNKNNGVFDLDWEMIIIDEAHEGVQTDLGEAVIKELRKEKTKILSLTGTAYGLRKDYGDNVFTWTYVDEQRAKREWAELHPNEKNPYADLPTMNILTFDLGEAIEKSYRYVTEDSAFNFREFFRTWTGNIENDFYPVPEDKNIGEFVHEDAVWSFLNLISTDNENTNYPFSKPEYVNMFKHTFWLVPGVKEAHALRELLRAHPFFRQYKIIDVAGDGDQEERYDLALSKVKKAIKENDKTITISCGRLTTGITVREWTAIMMLSGSSKTSVNGYMQAIFRVQSPGVIEGKQKENCYVFDFAPDRALQVIADVHKLSSKSKKGEDGERQALGEFLNFCPVIAVDGTEMHYYDVPDLMRQIKRISVESAINSGFDDNTIYLSDAGLSRSDFDLEILRKLSDVVAPKKKGSKDKSVEITGNGLTGEERQKLERIKKKPKKELTPEDKALLEKERYEKKEQQKLFDLLRAVSIRLPLLFYGSDADITEIIKLKDFVNIVDDESWEEFMPKGLRKELFLDISRYYDEDVLVGAGLRIRKLAKAADEYPPTIRTAKIVEILSKFKNPDKETVLTPWRVVNMHLGDIFGGYNFFDETYARELDEPRFIQQSSTDDILLNEDVKILEMNSKSGLYPLYMAFSIYRFRVAGKEIEQSLEDLQSVWNDVLARNIFVLCKTKMARSITIRTLVGYSGAKVNAIYLPHLIERMKDEPDRFKNKMTNPATWEYNAKEGERMKFDAIVGNPPYQENISSLNDNSSLSKQLFPYFIMGAISINAKYISLITPSRWFTAEAQDKSFIKLREFVKNNNHFISIFNFANNKLVFPNVEIAGGVNYFLFSNNYSGNVLFAEKYENNQIIMQRPLFEDGIDIIIAQNISVDIIHKIKSKKGFIGLSTIATGRNPFGIVGKESSLIKISKDSFFENSLKLYCAHETIKYVDVNTITKGIEILKSYKVFTSKANGGAGLLGDDKLVQIIGKSYIAMPMEACTDSLIAIGSYQSYEEAVNLQKYMTTKFLRYLAGVLKTSQNLYQGIYQFVPIQDFTNNSDIDWSKPIAEIDKQLYNKYGLTQDEIDFIENKIKPME